jgi:hypothetical protein
MGFRKPKDNSDAPKVLGLDPMGCLLALISLVVGGGTDALTFDIMETTAQKMPNPELALLFLMFVIFVGSGGTLFLILNSLRKRIGW